MAIAFDAASGVSYNNGTTLTVAHTCTGTDRLLVACVQNFGEATTFTATYNSVAMTAVTNGLASASRHYMFYLLAPDSGTNNIVFTASGTCDIRGGGASYTGVKQTAQPDSSASNNTDTSDPHQIATTTVADNAWVVVYGGTDGTGLSAGATDTTTRTTVSSNCIGDRNAATTPAGAVTLGFTGADTVATRLIIASFAPVVAAGPANVKTVNGVAKASVKTINGVAIASVKTKNGVA